VPGANRPWLIESDEESQPLDGGRATEGLRGAESDGASRVASSGEPSVVASVAADKPHVGQKRAPSGIAAAHLEQDTGEFYAYSFSVLRFRGSPVTV
jgi:hypothetical protein